MSDFELEVIEGGAIFRLTRPAKLNSTTPAVWQGLNAALDRLQGEGGRFLIFTGAGEQAFCAGTDLGETTALSAGEIADRCDIARAALFRLAQSPLVSVAALNGLAYGGGLELATACTFRVAAPHVRLAVPEVRLGAMPAYGGTQFLPAIIGPSRALDLLLTGRSVDAAEAMSMGLVNRVTDGAQDVVDTALALARSICASSREAIDSIRAAVAASGTQVSSEGLAREGAVARALFEGEDCREGVAAFLEKRPPRFRH